MDGCLDSEQTTHSRNSTAEIFDFRGTPLLKVAQETRFIRFWERVAEFQNSPDFLFFREGDSVCPADRYHLANAAFQ